MSEATLIVPVSVNRGAVRAQSSHPDGYLFGRTWDFLLLGGASVFLLPLALLLPSSAEAPAKFTFFFLAFVINYPHFAHSYQLFYEGFRSGWPPGELTPFLKHRFLFAGIVVPVAIAGFLVVTVALREWRLLGLAGNAMAFFVGWHYVKQGYGMLMVDSALKRIFFTAPEKRVLAVNAYLVWAFTWISLNVSASERDLFGIKYLLVDLPDLTMWVAGVLCLASSCVTGALLLKYWRDRGGLLINGLVAYAATLYLWMVFVRIDPIWILIVPTLHSLQYLAVVWRLQLNRRAAAATGAAEHAPQIRLRRFIVLGIVLGAAGFMIVPRLLDGLAPLGPGEDTSTFLFAFWIFINVHHYFIDNVLWRRENPIMKRYLFAAP